MGASYLALWAIVLFVGLLSLGTLAEVRRLRAVGASTAELPLGAVAPQISGVKSRDDEPADTDSLMLGKQFLLFVRSGCKTCHKLLETLGTADWDDLTVISDSPQSSFTQLIPSHVLLLIDDAGRTFDDFGVNSTPTVVVLREGRVRSYSRLNSVEEFGELRQLPV